MKKLYYCKNCEAKFEAEETLFDGASAVCPACGKTRPIREFAEINFCPHCRNEVALGLNTAPGEQVRCPACGEEFRTAGTAAKLPAREGDLPPTLEAGDFFDKYRIERLLGRGGMGEVYLARHRLMDRVCALKILTVGGDPGAAARFVQEAKLANRISHPNIISVFDVGTELNTGRLFIAMEYVDGTSLSSLMRHRRFSEKELLLIGIGVCEALTAMEQYGVVHRDIKPANIMITRSGGIKLADLGIAKAGDRQYGDITLTRGTEVFGTPQYASPEQCRSAHSADHRSDIYSLGATLYHLAGGEPPYSGESSLAIVLKVLKEDPPPLWDRNTALSPELAALIESMMRRDPALRPQHASEVLARMKDILRTASDRIPVAVSAKPAARRRTGKKRPAAPTPLAAPTPPAVAQRFREARRITECAAMKKFYYCGGCAARFEAEESLFEGTSAVCPACGTTRPIGEFAVINFCPHCQSEIAIPLDVPPGTVLTCAECGSEIRTDSTARFDAAANPEAPTSERPPEPATLYAKGDLFDKFEIIRLLGRGGMGEVYLAKHLLLDRECALKILAEDNTGDPIAATRFIQEAKLANRIDHPNLVRVFDTGADLKTGRLFIAMEFVDGRTLSQVLRDRRFSEADALMVGIEVCKALEVMEANRIVHRDIKPSNIMIDHSGQVKLTDLGIAKAESRRNGEITLTRESVVFGTPEYASPEQCRSAHSADHRSDIYSLGATLFHLVGGEPPYSGETPLDVAAKVLKEPPRDLAALNPSLSSGFLLLIRDMMQRDPARRPAHASAVRARMEVLAGIRRPNRFAQLSRNLMQAPWLGKLRTTVVTSGRSITSAFGQAIRNPGRQKHGSLIVLLPILCIVVAVYFLIPGEPESTSKEPAVTQSCSPVARIPFPVVAQETDPSELQSDPAATAQESDMPPWLAKRLKHCRRMLAFPEVRNVPPRLAFFQAQRKLLEQQVENVRRAREAAKRYYLARNTRDVIGLLEKIRNISREVDIARNSECRKLFELVSDPRTDPNMKLPRDDCALIVLSKLGEVSVLRSLLSRHPLVPEDLSSSDPLLIRYGIPGIRFDPGGDSGMLTLCLLAGMPPGKMPEDRIVRHSSRIRSFGLSYLHFAVLRGWKRGTAVLLAAGADVSQTDAEGQTALHYAYKYGRQDLVDLLLNEGCDPNRKDKRGRTAAECAKDQPLYRACFDRDLTRMQQLVRTAEDANILLENGYTALEWACVNYYFPEPARLLLARGADPMRIGVMHFSVPDHVEDLQVLRKFLVRPDGYVHITDSLEKVAVRLLKDPDNAFGREYRAIIEQTIQAIPDVRTRKEFQQKLEAARQRAATPPPKIFRADAVTEEDPDGCGIPHRIKEQYGLSTSDPANVLDDLDGDGFSNLYEYKQNTRLDQPRSRPPLWHRLAVADIARLKLPLKLKAIMVQDPKDKFCWDVQINRLDSLQTEFTSLNRPVKIDGVDYRLKDIVVDMSEKDSGGNPIDKSYIDLESANGVKLRMQIGKDVFTPDVKAVLRDIGTGQTYVLSEKQTFRLGSIKTGRESYTVQSFDIQKQEVVLRYDSGRNKGKPVPEPITQNGKVPDSERVRGKNR